MYSEDLLVQVPTGGVSEIAEDGERGVEEESYTAESSLCGLVGFGAGFRRLL